ncbi:AfsR/SARP family transcriptional regulator [Pseudonocardiaceae bacterium YIM PH 21723]|nr:AfsR/SARP family transcriptional regulator [Pseudonocardiaceae bacterium YIM PH 21723]
MPQPYFGVLGPLVVLDQNTEVLTGLGKLQQRLLAALLVGDDRPTSPEFLIDLIWAEDDDGATTAALQAHISRVRAKLRQALGDSVALEYTSQGYRLHRPPGSLDLERFRTLLAAEEFQAAAELWRGPALANLSEDVRTRLGAPSLDQQYLDCVRSLAAQTRRTGSPADALPFLEPAVQAFPLDEPTHAELMLSLAAAGRQADAHAAFTAIRDRLREELGADPGPQLADAHQRILDRTQPEENWIGIRPPAVRLIGRDAEVTGLNDLLDSHRLVTITGPGGGGKTSLALHGLAARDHHTVVALPMASITSKPELVSALGALLELSAPSEDALLALVRDWFTERAAVLLLDNAEHLLEVTADLVDDLLRNCPRLTVLVTSRQPLRMPGELAWTLPPLALTDPRRPDPDSPALALFLQRARDSDPTADLSDLSAAARICHQVDGLPLALELAAARVRALSVGQIAGRLTGGLGLLAPGQRGGDARHRHLDATIEWSYQLLEPAERTVLEQISVFPSGFTPEAAEHVVQVDGDVLNTLVELIEKSLVIAYQDGPERRFRLLTAVREFGWAKLADQEGVATRHFRWRLRKARELWQMPEFLERVAEARAWTPYLADTQAAIRFGMSRGLWCEVTECVVSLFDVWIVHPGYMEQALDWFTQLAEHLDDCPAWLRVTALSHQASFAARARRYAEAVPLYERAWAAAESVPDSDIDLREKCDVLGAYLSLCAACLRPVRPELERRLAEIAEAHTSDTSAFARRGRGNRILLAGRYAELREFLTDPQTHKAASRGWLGEYYGQLALTEIALGNEDAALRHVDRLRGLIGKAGSPGNTQSEVVQLGQTLLGLGQPDAALLELDTAIARYEQTWPSFNQLGMAQPTLAESLRRTGQLKLALLALRRGMSIGAGSQRFEYHLPAVLVAAAIALNLGDAENADRLAGLWDAVRRDLGLAVPVGYHDAARTLGLDLAAPSGHPDPRAWDPLVLQNTIELAEAWVIDELS